MKKKLLALILVTMMTFMLTACGGDDKDEADKPAAATSEEAKDDAAEEESESAPELVVNEANGLKISLPKNVTYVETDADGIALLANDEGSIVVSATGKTEGAISASDVTKDVMSEAMKEVENAQLGDVATVEQVGGTAVVCMGTCSVEGEEMYTALQYFIPSDGSGYYVISYLYGTDETDFDDAIADILASVTTA